MKLMDNVTLEARTDSARATRPSLVSWFRRRVRNRKRDRKHVLDVKLRASQRRQNRIRRLTLFLLVVASLFCGLFAAWRGGEALLQRFVYENPAFAIHHLEVQTDGVISLDQLRRWTGVRLEDNLLALDLVRVRRDLELVPLIESAAIERVLPHTLRIRVTEREPLAQVALPQLPPVETNRAPITYLLDAKGFVMFPLEAYQLTLPPLTNTHLPLLVGLPATELRPGRQVESPQAQAALRLIVAFDRSSMAGLADLKEIDLHAPGILLATTGQRTEVTFGLQDFDTQVLRWRAVHDYGQKAGRQLAALDLSVANNVPVRWNETNSLDLPQPQKPLRYKKKNV
jgi:hypothetical protein